jgi:hypothetical protein
MSEQAAQTEQQVVSVVLTAGIDILGILVDETEDGLVIKDPQMFMLGTNQFIPYAATLASNERTFEIPHHAIALYGEPVAFFTHAYKETFDHHFALENSLILKEAKAKADIAELASPVHGKLSTDSGIILKS